MDTATEAGVGGVADTTNVKEVEVYGRGAALKCRTPCAAALPPCLRPGDATQVARASSLGPGRDVALVRALQPAPDVDMPLLFRDDEIAPSVLVLYRNFGRLEGSAEEGKTDNAAIRSFRDGRLARAALYIDRAEALKAVGLE